MIVEKLAVSDVWRAIDVYLANAYPGPPPAAVRTRLEALQNLAAAEFYTHASFERDTPVESSKFSLRLGNRFYPHMKLTIERSPDGQSFLFRADTHDRHCRPAAGSRECAAFEQLMEANQQIAQAIETAWADQNVPTFKTYLREDLAKRLKP